jgi:type 2 lantibiotic biosynthesis protein LanM
VNQEGFYTPKWCHAITLTERIASLRTIRHRTRKVETNADLAKRRMQCWQAQAPFTTGSYFAQRLAMDGISEEDFLYLLGEPIEALHDRFPTPPYWLAEFARAFSRPPVDDTNSIPLSEMLRGRGAAGFLVAVEPLIRKARERVLAGIQELRQTQRVLPFDPDMIDAVLFADLPQQLLMRLNRTMVLELHVARLQGLLCGDTAEARFHSFVEHLYQRETALALFQEYPVLARELTMCFDRWAAVSLEFLQRLCVDWEAIRTTFSPEKDPGVLVHVNGDAGDRHRGGRRVMIAEFSSGFRVVYKPRSLAVDVHFQELLDWLNTRGAHPPFRTLSILDRGTHGWVEFVAAQPCSSVDEVQRFYERQGAYLALLYALEAIDFHFENLIAVGEHPILVDLEALFHPHPEESALRRVEPPAHKTLAHSVLRVGLLPHRRWSNDESDGIDLSGLGAIGGQLTPHTIPSLEGEGTDEMRLVRTRMAIPGGQHRPILNGTEVDVLGYAAPIVAGFTTLYELVRKHRAQLLSDDGPLARFVTDDVRVLVRSTRTYSRLLGESFHPDVLRDALDRGRLFDRLWVGVARQPYLAQVIPAEREDLLKGDIPLFTTRPNSRDLWSSSNNRIADFFEEPGMALVRRRLQQLSDDDLARQCWFIRASLATLATNTDRATRVTHRLIEPHVMLDRERLVAAARAAGDRLEALALRGEDDVSWVGLTLLLNERKWSVLPLGADLYDGLPGVALFLAYLGAITREERYTALAQAVLNATRRRYDQSSLTLVGGFIGWGGVIYTLTHLGVLWDQPALVAEAEAMVERLPILIAQDEHSDILWGSAGCIGALISLYRCAPSDRTLAAAIQCGDRLLARAQAAGPGIGWITPAAAGNRPLAGFSHGAAGIAWALLELAGLTGEERFRAAALAAIAYERSLFSAAVGNWPDLREPEAVAQEGRDGRHSFVTAWCHGAPGIGLARLRSLPHLDGAATSAEIDTALKTTLSQGFGSNHSLCHGDLGNLELLLLASQMLEDPRWPDAVRHISAMILESIGRDGWLCGVPLAVEVPGLMTGIAGIGYELLRLAEPRRVPSVLVLAPPILE